MLQRLWAGMSPSLQEPTDHKQSQHFHSRTCRLLNLSLDINVYIYIKKFAIFSDSLSESESDPCNAFSIIIIHHYRSLGHSSLTFWNRIRVKIHYRVILEKLSHMLNPFPSHIGSRNYNENADEAAKLVLVQPFWCCGPHPSPTFFYAGETRKPLLSQGNRAMPQLSFSV